MLLAKALSPINWAWIMCQFAGAAVTKYHTLGGLDKKNVFFHSSGV